MRIGARGSDLAQWQARWVEARLNSSGIDTEMVIIKTHGDRVQDRPLHQLGVQGAFTVELEEALLDDRIDVAVHSFKDMALVQPPELKVVAISERANPADLLVVRREAVHEDGAHVPLAAGAVIGTSAIRRGSQLTARRPDLQLRDLRGNVPTRLGKLAAGDYDAIFLAAAGVQRIELDLSEFHVIEFDPFDFVPSPAQGALAIEMRSDDGGRDTVREAVHHAPTAEAVLAERQLLAEFGGGCSLPLGGYARKEDGVWTMVGFWGGGATAAWEREESSDPRQLAPALAQRLRENTN